MDMVGTQSRKTIHFGKSCRETQHKQHVFAKHRKCSRRLFPPLSIEHRQCARNGGIYIAPPFRGVAAYTCKNVHSSAHTSLLCIIPSVWFICELGSFLSLSLFRLPTVKIFIRPSERWTRRFGTRTRRLLVEQRRMQQD